MVRNEPVNAGQTVHGHIDTVAKQQKSGSIVPHGSEAVVQGPCNTFVIFSSWNIMQELLTES